MSAVWKFLVPMPGDDCRSFIDLPNMSQIVSAGIQGDSLVVWAIVPTATDGSTHRRRLIVVNTGTDVYRTVAVEDMPDMSDHAEIIREALAFGLEYHGHELDDVTGRVHAVTEDAKKFERAFAALDGLLADHAAETERLRNALAHHSLTTDIERSKGES